MAGGSSSLIGIESVGIGVGGVGSHFVSSCGAISSAAISSSSIVTLTETADLYCSSLLSLASSKAGLSDCSDFLTNFSGDGVMKSYEGIDVAVESECRQGREYM